MSYAGCEIQLKAGVYMKKRIMIIVSVVIVMAVAITAGVYMLLNKDNGKTATEAGGQSERVYTLAEELFGVRRYDDFATVTERHNVDIYREDMSYFVSDVDTFGEKMSFTITFDKNNELLKTTAFCYFDADFSNIESFKRKTDEILGGFAGLFGAEVNSYYIYSSMEVFDCSDIDSLNKVMNGEAKLEFRIRDELCDYWKLTIETFNNDKFLCLVEHYVDSAEYDGVPTNIDLS